MRRALAVFTLIFLGSLVPACSCGSDNPDKPDAPPISDAPSDGMVTPEVVCETLPPVTSGTCEVTAGGAAKLLKGTVLTPTTVYVGGQVAVDDAGKITCVGCNCAQGGETVITCPDGSISPGLINTHDHITFTQNAPYGDNFREFRYEHRHQWRRGDGPTHPRIPAPGQAPADAIRWGELRFLMSGATSIVGSGGQPGLLRNLDSSSNQEGLGQPLVNFDTFPLDDSDGTRRTGDCNYGGMPTTAAQIASNEAYEPHTSEGIDGTARNEFLCQSSTTYDTMTPGTSNNLLLGKTAMIHSIGLTPADYGAMATAGTGLIWSPRSNITLYGDTARVTVAARLGVEIALGTDWMPTGSMNMTRELACADSFNKTYLGGFFTDAQLWAMVTHNAASVIAMDDAIGILAPGRVADISVFTRNGKGAHRAVLEAEPKDVALVMRGGKVLYGDATAVEALAQSCDVVDVCTTQKRVCLTSEIGKTFAQLDIDSGDIYAAFACGVPEREPSCTPSRPTAVMGSTVYTGVASADDSDGDGLPNATDLCPNVFDPVRPMDNGMQGDADADGAGDACDVCPLDPNSTSCSVVDPNDRDNDGVANAGDNCPDQPNADQADGDMDGKGDVCDACPSEANPGAAGCPVSVYSIKNGTTPVGTNVRVENVIVTGKGTNGFFVQVKAGDAGYMGEDHSGLFVFTGANAPTLANAVVGTRVTIDGKVANFNGQLELDTVTAVTVVNAMVEAPPTPVEVTFAEVKTGGTRAMTLESVIVSINMPSTVTATNAMFGEFTLTAGADTLVVDDFLFAPNPPPSVGQSYLSVRGILAFRQMASKLEPRGAGDLTLGAAGLSSFGPSLSYARVGQTTLAPTFPEALTIQLTGASTTDTTVVLTTNSAALSVPSPIVIPAGETSATVPVTAMSQAASVTVTATVGTTSQQVQVRVLGTNEAPTAVSLSPSEVPVSPGGTVDLTATLDIPAPAGGTQLAIAVEPATGGSAPATVTVPENQVAATFTFLNEAASGSTIVRATLGASSSQSTIIVATGPSHLVVSQVYGGGGNTGAPLKNDFVELYNPTSATLSLDGLSIQYGSATGTTWQVMPLPAGSSIAPGRYFLVQLAAGSGTSAALPTPDATGTLMLASANGKIALVDGTDALSGACPTTGVIDLVGYGTANCSEGTPTAALSNTTGALRNSAGCADSDDNAADFAVVAPAPRNSASPASSCT